MKKEMSHVKIELNLLQYLHEKAQESRNKEMQGCLMFLAGAIFFAGGLLESLSLTEDPQWFIFIPYHASSVAGAMLGLTMTISGLLLMTFGVVIALKWRINRKSYIEKLRKASSKEWGELTQNRSIDFSKAGLMKTRVPKPSLPRTSVPKPSVPKLETLGEWWVYDNWAAKATKARVHRGTCTYCNHGKGINPKKTTEQDRKWRGPYPTWREAWKVAQKLRRKETTFCKKCCGKLIEITQKRGDLKILGLMNDADKMKQST
ncbi:MAG: hypothetical protein PVH12_08655 [Candidatus Bathyarchaeota archaeon]